MNSKRKGSAFERQMARLLGRWLYGDDRALRRNTGEPEHVYVGDIVPYRSDPQTVVFPYYIQCKTGYKRQSPDFWNFAVVRKWLTEAVRKIRGRPQQIIFLVVRFKNRPILLFSSQKIDRVPHPVLILPLEVDGEVWDFYLYHFTKVFQG